MTPSTPGQPTLHELTQRIKGQALAVGFDRVGVVPYRRARNQRLSAGSKLDTLARCTISNAAGSVGGIYNRFCWEHNRSWYVALITIWTIRILQQ